MILVAVIFIFGACAGGLWLAYEYRAPYRIDRGPEIDVTEASARRRVWGEE